MSTQALKKPQGKTTAFQTPASIVPEPQVESFVYRSMESAADRIIVKAPAVQQEMHSGVYATLILCWTALVGIFALTFWGSPYAMYMVAVSTLTGVAYFALPIVLSRVAPKTCDVCFVDFLRGQVSTIYGPVSGFEALVQVIMVPASLTLGAVAIAFIVQAAKLAY